MLRVGIVHPLMIVFIFAVGVVWQVYCLKGANFTERATAVVVTVLSMSVLG